MEIEVLFVMEEIILQGGVSDARAGDDDHLSLAHTAVSFEHRNSFSIFTISKEGGRVTEARLKRREALESATGKDAEMDLRAGESGDYDIQTLMVEDLDGSPQVWVDDRPSRTKFWR